jgi:phage FluMu protein Com
MQVRCDKCDRTIEVADPAVGMKVNCPACGDVNLIRTIDSPKAVIAKDRAAEAGYPPANGPETEVLKVRPAMLRAHPIRFIGLSLGLLAGAAGAVYFGMMVAAPQVALAAGSGVLAATSLVWLLLWKLRILGEGLTVTTKRIVDREGLFSKATSEVLHADIKNIQVKQSFLDRVWNVGMLAMSSSAENEDVIVMHDVPDPERVRRVIDLYRRL